MMNGKLRVFNSSFIVHHFAHAFSNPAYFSISFFCPKPGKLTVSFAASPVPSRRSTSPRPYFGWRTCEAGAKSPPAEDEELRALLLLLLLPPALCAPALLLLLLRLMVGSAGGLKLEPP